MRQGRAGEHEGRKVTTFHTDPLLVLKQFRSRYKFRSDFTPAAGASFP